MKGQGKGKEEKNMHVVITKKENLEELLNKYCQELKQYEKTSKERWRKPGRFYKILRTSFLIWTIY